MKYLIGLFMVLVSMFANADVDPRTVDLLLEQGRLAEAKPLITQALIDHPDSARAHLLNAYVLTVEGYKYSAKDELKLVDELDKKGNVVSSGMYKNVHSNLYGNWVMYVSIGLASLLAIGVLVYYIRLKRSEKQEEKKQKERVKNHYMKNSEYRSKRTSSPVSSSTPSYSGTYNTRMTYGPVDDGYTTGVVTGMLMSNMSHSPITPMYVEPVTTSVRTWDNPEVEVKPTTSSYSSSSSDSSSWSSSSSDSSSYSSSDSSSWSSSASDSSSYSSSSSDYSSSSDSSSSWD